jgi:DNA polymerase alpha subunit B
MQASLVAEHDLGELGDMGRASQDKVVVIGRVCCEAEGKLNSMSLVLEGGIEASNGARVKLDVQYVPDYSFFPGQVVAVEGINTEGHTLIASKVFRSALPPAMPAADRGEETPAPTVWVATGPFTASADFEFEVHQKASNSPPDIIFPRRSLTSSSCAKRGAPMRWF